MLAADSCSVACCTRRSGTACWLQARSQEARANWETALDTKDRAIAQLEEALESSKRALVRAASSAVFIWDEKMLSSIRFCSYWHTAAGILAATPRWSYFGFHP